MGGDLQLGPSRARVPSQRPLLGAGRLPGDRLGRPLASGRAAVVERRTPDRYVAVVEAGRPLRAGEEVLTDGQRRFEALALSLRTRFGVPLDALPDHPDLDGLVDRSGGRAVLTVRGRLLANAVTARLAAPGRRPPARAGGRGPAGTIPPYA